MHDVPGITTSVEKGKATDVIYLDLTFDTVLHDILVAKLEKKKDLMAGPLTE